MKDILELYNLAEKDNIDIYSFVLGGIPSMSLKEGDKSFIALNPKLIHTEKDEKAILAHELGHCECNAFYCYCSPLQTRGRQEYRADKWATKKLISIDELRKAICEGLNESWELAEYFGVTEEFILKAISIYKRQNLI